MSFSVDMFLARRPILLHITPQTNLAYIREARRLFSAGELYRQAGRRPPQERRLHRESLHIGRWPVSITDQRPLNERNIEFPANFGLRDFLVELNRRVFFWAAPPAKTPRPAEGYFKRYQQDGLVVLRVLAKELFRANRGQDPQFCKYNSGAPRQNQGRKIPRGPDTFVSCKDAAFRPSHVVEVAFVGEARLPDGVEVGRSLSGPWQPL